MHTDDSLRAINIERSEEARIKFLPHISIDCVLFGFHNDNLRVLLLRMKDQKKWALPGGYIGKYEDAETAASRILLQRTSAQNIFLEHFGAFTSTERTEVFFSDYPDSLWYKQRFISLGFYALVNYMDVHPKTDILSVECEWRNIDDIPEMMMDHRQIFDGAFLSLKRQLSYKPIGFNLVPEIFTMAQLQRLYEIILGKKLHRANFYRKMIAYDILDKMDEPLKTGRPHKSPNLFKFNAEKYKTALENGLTEGW